MDRTALQPLHGERRSISALRYARVAPGASTPKQLLDTGAELRIPTGPGATVTVRCTLCEQRNWSRVAIAEVVDAPADFDHEWLFLKQFIDRGGVWYPELLEYERHGAFVARRVLESTVTVPDVLLIDDARVLLAFRHVKLRSTDLLLRREPQRFDEVVPTMLRTAVRMLEAMSEPPTELVQGLPVKQRPWGGPPTALNFKGFDIRNLGARESHEIVMFDLGRPYLAPIEEAAAKMLISIGLLNWGRPLSRFLRGPDSRLLQTAGEVLADYLDQDAIDAEIALQRSFRVREPKGSGAVKRGLKRLGIRLLGGRYLDRLQQLTGAIAARVPA